MGQFALAIENFKKKVDKRADFVVAKIIIDFGTSVVYKSPVGDASYWKSEPPKGYVGGHFRGNWKYGLDNPDLEVDEGTDASGAITVNALTDAVGYDQAARHIHYFTNNVPYAQRLEDGYSRQAPQGMIKLTIMEFQPIVAKAVAAVK